MPFSTQPPFPLVLKTNGGRRGTEHWTVTPPPPLSFDVPVKGIIAFAS